MHRRTELRDSQAATGSLAQLIDCRMVLQSNHRKGSMINLPQNEHKQQQKEEINKLPSGREGRGVARQILEAVAAESKRMKLANACMPGTR